MIVFVAGQIDGSVTVGRSQMDKADAGEFYGAFPAFGEKGAAESFRHQAGDKIRRRTFKSDLWREAGLHAQRFTQMRKIVIVNDVDISFVSRVRQVNAAFFGERMGFGDGQKNFLFGEQFAGNVIACDGREREGDIDGAIL